MPNITPPNTFDNDRSLNEPQELAISFIKYFVNVATNIKSSIRSSEINFHGFLPSGNMIYFFSTPLIKLKLKAIGPNRIPTKIINILINEVLSK